MIDQTEGSQATFVEIVVELVRNANITRDRSNLNRRFYKLFEEIGEVSEAFLSSTSQNKSKNKTWKDVREEAVDVLIIALDIALTKLFDDDQLEFPVRDTTDSIPYETALSHMETTVWSLAAHASYLAQINRLVRNETAITTERPKIIDDILARRSIMVFNAFQLVDQVFMMNAKSLKNTVDKDKVIIAYVNKKLAKWAKNRKKKLVLTDAE